MSPRADDFPGGASGRADVHEFSVLGKAYTPAARRGELPMSASGSEARHQRDAHRADAAWRRAALGMAASPAMHEDLSCTDASAEPGPGLPTARVSVWRRQDVMAGMCPVMAFDHNGDMVTVSWSRVPLLMCIDPRTLTVHDRKKLPKRSDAGAAQFFARVKGAAREERRRGFDATLFSNLRRAFKSMFLNPGGGAYFIVDLRGRVVIPTADASLWIVERSGPDGRKFGRTRKLPVPSWALEDTGDTLVAVMPVIDATGTQVDRVYWLTTRRGRVILVDATLSDPAWRLVVGRTTDPVTPQVYLRDNEEIVNGFAVNESGAFVVTTSRLIRAMVAIDSGARAHDLRRAPVDTWTSPDVPADTDTPRGFLRLTEGSGTTPTLLGTDFVAICDGQTAMHVRIYRQADLAEVGDHRVFECAASAGNESSLICLRWDSEWDASESERVRTTKWSVFAGNNMGYEDPYDDVYRRRRQGGVARLDLNEAGEVVNLREVRELDVFTGTPKLSVPTGRIFAYTFEPPTLTWKLIAIDWRTLEVVYDMPIYRGATMGSGATWSDARLRAYDNGWATLTLRGRSVFVGLWNGFMQVRDDA